MEDVFRSFLSLVISIEGVVALWYNPLSLLLEQPGKTKSQDENVQKMLLGRKLTGVWLLT